MTIARTITLACLFAAISAIVAVNSAQAGGCGGGGNYGGYTFGHHRHVERVQTYRNDYFRQPAQRPVYPSRVTPVSPQGQVVQQGQPGFGQQPAPQVGGQQVTQRPAPSQTAQIQPTQTQPQRPVAQQPAPTQPAPTQTAEDAQVSALQALAGMAATEAEPQQQPAATPQPQATPTTPAAPAETASQAAPSTPSDVGVWKANLPNGVKVELNLAGNGVFTWTTINNGQESSFSGSYQMGSDSLTLVRTTDNQQLAGDLTRKGANAFNFKIGGEKDGGLDFYRS